MKREENGGKLEGYVVDLNGESVQEKLMEHMKGNNGPVTDQHGKYEKLNVRIHPIQKDILLGRVKELGNFKDLSQMIRAFIKIGMTVEDEIMKKDGEIPALAKHRSNQEWLNEMERLQRERDFRLQYRKMMQGNINIAGAAETSTDKEVDLAELYEEEMRTRKSRAGTVHELKTPT